MRTYWEDLEELNISVGEFDELISRIYDKTAEEMVELAKKFSVAPILSAEKRAFERVLAMRQAERVEAYKIYYGED